MREIIVWVRQAPPAPGQRPNWHGFINQALGRVATVGWHQGMRAYSARLAGEVLGWYTSAQRAQKAIQQRHDQRTGGGW